MIRAIAEALFALETTPSDDGTLDAFVTDIDGFMSPASKALRSGLLLMLEALRWLPVIVVRKLSAFEDLPVATRTLMLERMDRSRFSPFPLMVVAFKTLLTIAYYEDDARLQSIGYPGAARKRYLVTSK